MVYTPSRLFFKIFAVYKYSYSTNCAHTAQCEHRDIFFLSERITLGHSENNRNLDVFCLFGHFKSYPKDNFVFFFNFLDKNLKKNYFLFSKIIYLPVFRPPVFLPHHHTYLLIRLYDTYYLNLE